MTSVLRRRRIAAARDDIMYTQLTNDCDCTSACGIYDPRRLMRVFRRRVGVNPTVLQRDTASTAYRAMPACNPFPLPSVSDVLAGDWVS